MYEKENNVATGKEMKVRRRKWKEKEEKFFQHPRVVVEGKEFPIKLGKISSNTFCIFLKTFPLPEVWTNSFMSWHLSFPFGQFWNSKLVKLKRKRLQIIFLWCVELRIIFMYFYQILDGITEFIFLPLRGVLLTKNN